jgi:transcriptional regulator with XRE-family HTH domain
LAQMLAFRFLGEVEKITDERHTLRKDLAKLIGVSPGYITQLYRGTKPLNIEALAKMESVFDIRFEIKAVEKELLENDLHENCLENRGNIFTSPVNRYRRAVWIK